MVRHWGMPSRGVHPHHGQGRDKEAFPGVQGSQSTSTHEVHPFLPSSLNLQD